MPLHWSPMVRNLKAVYEALNLKPEEILSIEMEQRKKLKYRRDYEEAT